MPPAIADGGPVGLREAGKLGAMMSKEGFVGGDHRFAGGQRLTGKIEGDTFRAADQLDDGGDFGIGRERHRVLVPTDPLEIDAAITGSIARRDRLQADLTPSPRGEQSAVFLQ